MMEDDFALPLKNMEIVCMAVGRRSAHMRGSILPSSLNIRATRRDVRSCKLRY